MNPQVQQLFRELADLSPADREQIFRDRHIGSEVRAELESLRLELWRHWDTKLPNNLFVRRQLEAARQP
jgi:hypothetical protein